MASHETYDPDKDVPRQLPPRPLDRCICPFLPRTRAKELFLAWRWKRGVSLFHPEDARMTDRQAFTMRPTPNKDREPDRLVEQTHKRKPVKVKRQLKRPESAPYSDGPGMAERRQRMKEKLAYPAQKKRVNDIRVAAKRWQRKKKKEERAAAPRGRVSFCEDLTAEMAYEGERDARVAKGDV